MKRGKLRKIGWWVTILVIVFLLLWGMGSRWKWFSPPHTWSDIAILIQEVEEKTKKLNQILQEATQLGGEEAAPLNH